MMKRVVRWGAAIGILAYSTYSFPLTVSADTLQSSNYKFSETALGSGGLIQSNSTNYRVSDTIGDLSVGTSASSNFQIATGHTTTNDPALSFSINSGGINFGTFSATSASVSTATFSIINYTSYGYVVQLIGSPPSNGATTLSALASNSASTVGVSQFGINLVANTLPTSVGANPNNGQFGFGSAATNYATPNSYRYVSGETIAQAAKSSGLTTYTISYLINVPALTPGGIYTSNQTLVVTGTY
jgi:hypothetical protein